MIKFLRPIKNNRLILIYYLVIVYPFSINAKFFETSDVTLRWLDKVTGRVSKLDLKVGEIIQIGVLDIQVQTCMKTCWGRSGCTTR